MRSRYHLVVGIALFFGSATGPVQATMKGWFCEACTSVESARQQAKQHVRPLQCGSGNYFDQDMSCQAPPSRKVVLANRESRSLYVFEVFWRKEGGVWRVKTRRSSIDSELAGLAYDALDIVTDWEMELAQINSDWEAGQGTNAAKTGAGVTSEDSADCPADTALRTLMDQSRMDSLEMELKTRLERAIARTIASRGVGIDAGSITVGSGPLSFGLVVTDSGRAIATGAEMPFFSREIDLNENPPTGWFGAEFPIWDRLVFSAESINLGNRSRVDLNLELGMSVVLGIPADNLLSGNQEITDPCALEALALGAQEIPGGEYRDRDTGAVVDPADTFLSGGQMTTPGGDSGTVQLCLYDFYSNDVYQFSAWLPCGEENENEEIRE